MSGAALGFKAPFRGPFWCSPSGSDTVGDGTQGNPWRQLAKARDFIRTFAVNASMAADVVVNVRQGSYVPIALTHLDSGSGGHSVRYVSYDGPGLAVIECGTQITNWTNVTGNIFKASVPNTFWTMYENDVRSVMCRTPKLSVNPSYPASKAPYFRALGTNPDLVHLYYTPSDFNPAGWPVSDLGVFEWSGGNWNWFSDTNTVTSIDTTNHILTFGHESKFVMYQNSTGSRYYLQGVQAMQSDPGEWYLDRGAGELYYYARDGAIDNQVIVVPSPQEGITLTGRSWKNDERVSHVVFDGFAVKHTDFTQWYRPGWPVPGPGTVNGPIPNPWPEGYIYAWQACMPQHQVGAVRFTNADNCQFTNGHIKNAGMYGVIFTGYGQQHAVSNSWIEGVGLAGVRAEGQFPGLGDVLQSCTFTNLRVNAPGELSSQGCIQLANSGKHTVSYCELYNSPRQGLWIVGDNYGDLSDPAVQVYTGGTLIDHVLIRNCCQDSADVGGLGLDSFGNAPGRHSQQCTVSQVITHDNRQDPRLNSGPLPYGIFTDDLTYGQVFSNCHSYNNQNLNFKVQTDSGEHSYTNTSFLADGSNDPSFNVGLIDTANIGTTSGFPYP